MKHHRSTALTFATVAGLLALQPRPAVAACGVTDPGGCVDGALYSFWYGLAGMGWSLDRTLLLLAYQLDAFRWWLVEVAFTSAYQVLVQIINPLILPVATIAVILGCLATLLLPLFGKPGLVNVRHALVWTTLAPLLLTLSGPLIVQLEQLRSEVGSALFTGVSQIAPGAIFGASASDMGLPKALYPSNPCGGAALERHTATGGLRLDDLAAALLWADAEDIHCPDKGGPSPDIPDGFYEAAPNGPQYAVDQDVSLMDAGNNRTQAVTNMQRGAIRTFLGLLPSSLAVLDALVQLVFALCLIALWVGLPIGLVFVFFSQTAGGVTGLFRRMLGVLQVSWSSSVLLGIVAACLLAAAQLRNAAAYTGFSIGGIVLTAYMLFVAVDTLKDSVRTLNDTVAGATGLSITRPFELASQAAGAAIGVGAAVATGGASTALTAAAALQQTGSGRYAAAAALGRIRPVAQLGEVAAAMGWVEDEEIVRGLHIGERSTKGDWYAARQRMLTDAKTTDDQGRSLRERAGERAISRELVRAQRPTIVQEVSSFASGVRHVHDYLGSEQMGNDLSHAASWLPERTRLGWERVRQGWQDFGADVSAASGETPNLVRRSAAVAQVLDDRLRTGQRGAVMTLGERRRIHYTDPPTDLPAEAITVQRGEARIPRLLMLGYAVQERKDGTVALWQTGKAASATSAKRTSAADDERQRLVKAGALIASAAEASTRSAQARVEPTQSTNDQAASSTVSAATSNGQPATAQSTSETTPATEPSESQRPGRETEEADV